LVGYLVGRFSVFWPFFFFSVKLEKNRPILQIGRFSRQLVGKSADFLPIKNLRMSSDLQEEDKKRMRMKKRMKKNEEEDEEEDEEEEEEDGGG
ncbi:unnamed protein product, partial [Staurois parvus]